MGLGLRLRIRLSLSLRLRLRLILRLRLRIRLRLRFRLRLRLGLGLGLGLGLSTLYLENLILESFTAVTIILLIHSIIATLVGHTWRVNDLLFVIDGVKAKRAK